MATSYASEHASAKADVGAAGASVTWTRTTNTYTDPTDTIVPATTTITGSAIRSRGNPLKYSALGLVQSEAPTLFFTPTTYGECPLPGDTVTWNSVLYTARDVEPIAPSGAAIAARVIVSR